MTYLYDQNGNMTSDGTKCYEYNDANQLKKVKQCSNNQLIAEYVYDYKGKRLVKKNYVNGVLNNTVYSPTDEYETKKKADGTTENTTYYTANNEVVAKKNPDGSINYYHNDHLGSNSVLTNQSGAVVEKTTYEPYGEVKTGGTKSKFQYTGQEKDLETGLNYYDARYYDPHIQRFVQPDSLLPDAYDPQQLNRYAYARNNPIRYNDPSGHCIGPIAIACAAVLAYPVSAFIALAASALFLATSQGQQATKTIASGIATGISTLLNKSSSSTTNQKATSSSPQTSGSQKGQNFNPIQKIAPAIPPVEQAAEKIHGNDLRTTTQTIGYKLVDKTSGVVMKIGQTIYPATRYPQKWMDINNLEMVRSISGSKANIRIWEHEQIGEYIFKYGEAPALNNIEHSVNVFH